MLKSVQTIKFNYAANLFFFNKISKNSKFGHFFCPFLKFEKTFPTKKRENFNLSFKTPNFASKIQKKCKINI